jgi:hypothetical protein
MDWILGVAGAYLVFDGVYSYIRYESQSWFEQAIRVVRALCGVGLIVYGYYS